MVTPDIFTILYQLFRYLLYIICILYDMVTTVAYFNRQVESCVNLMKIDLNHYKYPQY